MRIRSVRRGRFRSRRSTGLVPGQQVRGRVISRLDEGLFRVSVAGQIIEAKSDLPLKPGQRLIANVEIGESNVILRLREDTARRDLTKDRGESQEEIRRILQGLGHHPDIIDILEFQERLNRYRLHGYLKGSEPSDAWVMAI